MHDYAEMEPYIFISWMYCLSVLISSAYTLGLLASIALRNNEHYMVRREGKDEVWERKISRDILYFFKKYITLQVGHK